MRPNSTPIDDGVRAIVTSGLRRRSMHTTREAGMDDLRFDAFIRSISRDSSRRGTLRLLAGGALAAGGGLVRTDPVGANHFGCRHVGKPCGTGRQCCSSRCRHGRCRPHNKGICTAGQNFCTQGGAGNECGAGSSGPCLCVVTTGNAPFCAENFTGCFACTHDAQCENFLGKGSACVSGGSACACTDPTKTMCALPCQSPT
jgi:hypothetical protein